MKKFKEAMCIKSGTYYGGVNFKIGEIYPIVGDNNGKQLIYADNFGDAKVMMLFDYADGPMRDPDENEENPVFTEMTE